MTNPMLDHTLTEKLKKIKLLVMDVDGTLTDGAMYYSANGEELKRFSTRDGMGVTLLHRGGIQTAILTTENTPIVSARARKLGIEHVLLGSRNKQQSFTELLERLSIPAEEAAYIGDDVNDEQPIRMAGISACPADAVAHIRSLVHIVSSFNGGNGAVREFAEMILTAQEKECTLPVKW